MYHHVTQFARTVRAFLTAALAATLLVLTLGAASAQAISVTALEKKVIDTAHAELVEGVYDVNNKLYPSGQPYDIGAAWCGSFLNWVMKQGGVTVAGGGGRPSASTFNVNVAKAWAHHGAKGGGYGRWSTAYDAMPGDLLVYGYDGTATTGGHVTMVVANTTDPKVVWTIGGNEGDKVRLQKRTLGGSGMYLVTLSEFRTRTTNIFSEATGAPKDVGDLTVSRYPNGSNPSVKVTKIVYKGTTYSGSTLGNSGFKIKISSTTSTFGITSVISTHPVNWVVADRAGDQGSMATGGPYIDYSRQSSSGGTT